MRVLSTLKSLKVWMSFSVGNEHLSRSNDQQNLPTQYAQSDKIKDFESTSCLKVIYLSGPISFTKVVHDLGRQLLGIDEYILGSTLQIIATTNDALLLLLTKTRFQLHQKNLVPDFFLVEFVSAT